MFVMQHFNHVLVKTVKIDTCVTFTFVTEALHVEVSDAADDEGRLRTCKQAHTFAMM
jgi:hypothetical protein